MSIFDNQNFAGKGKRVAPRYQVDLKASVIITVVTYCEIENESYFIMHGRLLNISRSGLALIISNRDMQELSNLKGDLLFRLLLPLPAEAIELESAPVRYQKLSSDENSEVLIGASITNINDRERRIFTEFINQFESPESVNEKTALETAKEENYFKPNKIIGMDVYEAFVQAKQHGYSIRVIRKNGSECLVQRNHHPNRIDVATQQNVIVEVLGFS